AALASLRNRCESQLGRLGSVASREVKRDRADDVARALQVTEVDLFDGVLRRVQDVVAPEHQDRGHAATRERLLVAPATADAVERHAGARRGRAEAVLERARFVRRLEDLPAAANDIKVDHRDEALDAAGARGHPRDVRLGSEETLLLARELAEDHRALEPRSVRGG